MPSTRALTVLCALLLAACGEEQNTNIEPTATEFEGGKADSLAKPIKTLTCTVADPYVRPGGFARVEVHAHDAEGRASRNYQVTVEPVAGTRVVQRNKVIFDHEGSYQITCCALDAVRCDTTGVQVGRAHPMLVAQTTPYSDDGLVRLHGRAVAQEQGPLQVTVNGDRLDLDANGRFGAFMPISSGINTFEVVATDDEGRSSTVHNWSLGGPFRAAGALQANAAQISLGADGFDLLSMLLAEAVEGFLSSVDLEALLSHRYEGTLDERRWTVQPQYFDMDRPSFDIQAALGGADVAVQLYQITFEATIGADIALLGWTERRVTINLSQLALTGKLISWGQTLELQDAAIDLSAPEIDVAGLPDFLVEAALYFVEDQLIATLKTQLKTAVEQQIANLALAFVASRIIELPEPLWGSLEVHTTLDQITMDARGLQAQLAWAVDGDTDPRRAEAPGYVITEGQPTITHARPLEIALTIDALNATLFAAWQVGALDLSLEVSTASLDRVDTVEVQGLDLFLDPQLPPLVRPGDQPGEYLLELAGLRLDGVMETDLGVVNIALLIGATLHAQIFVDEQGLNVRARVDHLISDVLIPPKPLEVEPARRLLERLLQEEVLPRFADVLKTLPIPEADLSKINITDTYLQAVELELMPGNSGVLHLSADLSVR